MLYLLDANVIIDANREYYEFESVPEYWEWLIYQAEQNRIKMPLETYNEIKENPDKKEDKKTPFFEWFTDAEIKKKLILDEEVDIGLVNKVTYEGYLGDPSDDDVETIGRDPFIIAYALASPADRMVVTTEVSKSSRINANRHVPDVCDTFRILHCTPMKMNKDLKFKTSWERK